jgi:hypothetical protein
MYLPCILGSLSVWLLVLHSNSSSARKKIVIVPRDKTLRTTSLKSELEKLNLKHKSNDTAVVAMDNDPAIASQKLQTNIATIQNGFKMENEN